MLTDSLQGAILLAVIVAWVDMRSAVRGFRLEQDARHKENLRRFSRLEGNLESMEEE